METWLTLNGCPDHQKQESRGHACRIPASCLHASSLAESNHAHPPTAATGGDFGVKRRVRFFSQAAGMLTQRRNEREEMKPNFEERLSR
jgi:hypothetical protein